MNVPTTGNGSALAAQNRDNIAVGTNGSAKSLISWATNLSIPTSRLMMSEIGVPVSAMPVTDTNYDNGFTLALQQMFLEFNSRNMHVTLWAGGRWREALETFVNVDGSGGAPLYYRTTQSSVLLQNLKGANSVTAGRGFNFSGAEFSDAGSGGGLYRGTYGQQWVYPQAVDFQALQSIGVTEIRFPIRQERLQPNVLGAFDSAELTRLQNVLTWCNTYGIKVYIDPHQYGGIDFGAAGNTGFNNNTVVKLGQNAPATQNGTAIPSGTTVEDCMVDFNHKLVVATKDYPALWGWGTGNEPNNIPGGITDLKHYLNRTVEDMRTLDTTHTIFVGGYNWQGFAAWSDSNGTGHLLTGTIPAGQPGAGGVRGVADTKIVYDGHMYFDATGQYLDSNSSFATLNAAAISAGYAAYNNSQPPTALDITSQTVTRVNFTSPMQSASDFAGTYDAVNTGTNTVVFNSNGMTITMTNTSDEGDVKKSLTGTAISRTIQFDLTIDSAATISSSVALGHFWKDDNSTDFFEFAINNSGSGYKAGLRVPSGGYTFVNSGATVLAKGTTYSMKVVVGNADVNLYIGTSGTAEATLTGISTSSTSVGGLALGKYYGSSLVGNVTFANLVAGKTVTVDSPPNGGLYYTPAVVYGSGLHGLVGFF